jgi:hypothetical protein
MVNDNAVVVIGIYQFTRMERVWVCDVPRGYAYR